MPLLLSAHSFGETQFSMLLKNKKNMAYIDCKRQYTKKTKLAIMFQLSWQ